MTTHRLTRNPRCLFDHRCWSVDSLLPVDAASTIADAFDAAEGALGGPATLELPRRPLVRTLRCSACGATRHPLRTVRTVGPDFACACGAVMRIVAADLIDRFGRDDATALLERTWQDVGVPPADVVVASAGDRHLHVLVGSARGPAARAAVAAAEPIDG